MLLLDEGWAQTIELATGLERARYQVTVLTANGRTASYQHRSVDWRCGPAIANPALLPCLDRLVAEGGFDHVIPLTEAAMTRLWDAGPVWAGRIYPAAAPWQRALLRDKYLLAEHLAARGIDVPRQRRLTPDLDLEALAREFAFPLVLKGATGVGGERVRIVRTARDLAAAVRGARALGGAWGVQELVEGPTVLFGGVFRDGLPLRVYAGDKLEQHPPRIGPAIRMRSIADPALVALGARVIRELRWTGFASVDFIRRRDGRYVFLEANPRLWGSAAAARAADIDLFTPFAALLAGAVPDPDLGYTAGREVRIFPRYLLSPRYWGPIGAVHAIRDLLGEQGRAWRHAGLLRHLAVRLHALRGFHRRRGSP